MEDKPWHFFKWVFDSLDNDGVIAIIIVFIVASGLCFSGVQCRKYSELENIHDNQQQLAKIQSSQVLGVEKIKLITECIKAGHSTFECNALDSK